jgi:uncharacterized protein YcbK (DUF882 family)
MLSMLTNGRVNPERENSMKNSDSTFKDHSSLFLNCQAIDILISSVINLPLRLKMEEVLNSGGSTKGP